MMRCFWVRERTREVRRRFVGGGRRDVRRRPVGGGKELGLGREAARSMVSDDALGMVVPRRTGEAVCTLVGGAGERRWPDDDDDDGMDAHGR